MIKRTDGQPISKPSEYKLDRSKYDYESDFIRSDCVYVWRYTGSQSVKLDNAFMRFSEDGIFEAQSRDQRPLSARIFSDPIRSTHGVYAVVNDSNLVLDYYTNIDNTFSRDYGRLRKGGIKFYKTVHIPWGGRSDLKHELVPKKVEYLDQYSLVYPGQSMLE